jgi:methanogenic corrinoid protein MtbC1
MRTESPLDDFVRALLEGSRQQCLDILREAQPAGFAPESLYHDIVWKAAERVARMLREDRIDTMREHLATRILRLVAAQLQMGLPRHAPNGRSIIIICADDERAEVGAQICAGLFEAHGWRVWLLGGGVPKDEIVTAVGQWRPDILLALGTRSEGILAIQQLISLIRETGSHPSMNIMVLGGVFDRTCDLWKEVDADVFGSDPADALKAAANAQPKQPSVPTVPMLPKKRRRPRRSQEVCDQAFPFASDHVLALGSFGG